ncbi:MULTISPECIES: methyl-accepting chemotaxis protein [Pantoea]|uniref:Methyl-accepting chemotaxis citrate transducer Tcp n=1 Tax=Pantoea ananatis (strain AJ13355) TaxID=932677 RepID=A0A0H3L6Q4_PANAA|nr:methyl-accepting chemotaxis protein [Pantoea ananatis]PQK75310.1 methyl-accepting chemotaxis protein [Pantoea ananatis]PQL08130.1 methyl-accepting chemotaxis protein [Pantoea ananatis]PVY84824.1 methyl-accepting chemotaxis sensory transducer with TarH sensor [Pantoea ananatis]CRH27852.1 Methyl-accepting chemotaxis citrate transducer [Pantoea ananatis]BAK13613.1 methyl-accepting chemotaxis citrate transducer Tcp [Pantoea ananatis AJ13355]
MLKNLKITTGIVAVLFLFSALLTITGFLFYSSVSQAGRNFSRTEQLTLQQQQLSDSVQTLIKTRVTISRVAIRFLKNQKDPASLASIAKLLEVAKQSADKADEYFQAYKTAPALPGQHAEVTKNVEAAYNKMHETMLASVDFLKNNNYQGYGNLDAQEAQDNLDKAYQTWRSANYQLMKQIAAENDSNYSNMLWTLLIIAIIALVTVATVWAGLRTLLLKPLSMATDYMRAISAGDLTQEIASESQNETGRLLRQLEEMRSALVVTIRSVDDATQSIFTGAAEVSAGSTDLSSRTEQQAAALEETAASMEQLTSTVKLNAENAQQATTMAKDASVMASQGGQIVAKVIANIEQISESSKQIASIIGIIDSIAFQTNILALNAAVEAARAGEQGRGFAVVAGEVRSLAGRSASAAQEIRTLIDQSTQRVNSGSTHASEAGDVMGSIVNSVNSVTQLMAEIASASAEQTRGIEQVSKAVSEMDGVTQQNAALVEESASAAASLEDQATQLRQSVAVFNTGRTPAAGQNVLRKPSLKKPLAESTSAGLSAENWQSF